MSTKSKAAKSKPATKSVSKSKQDKPVETKVEAAAPAAEPTVTTVVDTPAAEAPEVKPAKKAGREQQNGITRPNADTLCGKVWAALDVLRAKGEDGTFDAVRELAGKEMADATIRTQRQRWREFHGIKREEKKPARKSGKSAAAKDAAPAVISEEAQQQTA